MITDTQGVRAAAWLALVTVLVVLGYTLFLSL